jgi:CSLREA domain-containing protein
MKQIPFDPSRIKLLHVTVCAMMIVGLVLNVGMPVAHAASFTVTRTDDPIPDGCDLDGCSLREAIIAANANSETDIITLPAGTYTLSITEANEDAAATGDLDITATATDAITITGAGAATTIIDASGLNDRVFEVRSGANLTISGVTIRNGNSTTSTDTNGGGILNSGGNLTVNDSIISGNNAGFGGGVLTNGGTATINNSTITQNTANVRGGGLFNLNGTLNVNNSVISMNSVRNIPNGSDTGYNGGGIRNFGGQTTITNSTISGNTTGLNGGGIANANSADNSGVVILNNITITANTADSDSSTSPSGDGGGIFNGSGTINVRNSIIAGNNDAEAPDCGGTNTSQGNNLIGNGAGCTGFTNGVNNDLVGADPLLGALQGNGGATQTHAIAATSPARNTGNPSTCAATDQRGVARPQGAACDIGAFEIAPPTISKAFAPDTITTGGVSTLTFTIATLPNTGALTGVSFTDAMPAAIVVAATPNVQNTCGGTPTANSGDSQIGLSGGAFAGGVSCTVSVNVTSATAGSYNNTSSAVSSNETGEGNTASATLNVNNPSPAISSLNPSSVVAGSGAFTLVVNGNGFVNGSVVRWNGADRTTTFVSATQLQAAITAADIASTGNASITVFNPAPGGGESNAATLTIAVTGNPLPTATALSPNTVVAGGDSFVLTITGTGFIDGVSTVRWNGTELAPNVASATQLTVTVPASLIATPGTASVTVFNAAPGGGESLPALTVTITASNPQPAITSIDPNSVPAGSNDFTLTVNGSGFVSGSQVVWNSTALTTTFVSPNQLTATVPASLVAAPGTAAITVVNAGPGGGSSNSLPIEVSPASQLENKVFIPIIVSS